MGKCLETPHVGWCEVFHSSSHMYRKLVMEYCGAGSVTDLVKCE